MATVTLEEVRGLARHAAAPCVSIYMPTHRMAGSAVEDRLRFKNMVGEAQGLLTARGLRRPEAAALLRPLQETLRDDAFWMRTLEGLAAFAAPGFFRSHVLPLAFDEALDVAGRFHLRPLIQALSIGGAYHALALGKNGVTLFDGSGFELRERMLPPRTPRSLADVLKLYSLENLLDFHTRTPRVGSGGFRSAVFHSDKEAEIALKQRVSEYFRLVDRGVNAALREHGAPLVLAGVEYLVSIYREVSAYPKILPGAAIGSPERTSAAELHARTWGLARAHLDGPRREALNAFMGQLSAGRASGDPEEVLLAARQGRVWALLCLRSARLWGDFDAESGRLALGEGPGPGAEDVSDLAAIMTIESGGAVYEAAPGELPAGVSLGAIYRHREEGR